MNKNFTLLVGKRIWKWINKTRLRKFLSLTLITLITLIPIRYLLLPAKEVSADSTLGFDEGYGTSVTDRNATLSGTIANALWKSEEFCKRGKCLYFDGSGDYVNFGNDSDVTFTTGSFTITGWFRTPDITSGQRTIIAKHNATAGGYKIYIDSNGYVIFGIDDDSAWTPDNTASTSANSFDDNKWHHFAAAKNGTTSISIYVDGRLYQTTSSIVTGSLTNTNNFYAGIDGDGTSNGFSGFLDEIKVYSGTARSDDQIKADFTGETSSRGTSVSFGPDNSWLSDGLVGYWKLDETSGNANDTSGNSSTLTNVSTTAFTQAKFGNGIEPDGTADYMHSGDNSALSATGSLTLAAWIIPDDISGTENIIAKWDGANESYRLTKEGANIRMYIDADSNYEATTGSPLTANGIYHVAGVYDSLTANVKLYVNGQIQTSSTTGTIPSSIGDDAGQFQLAAEDHNNTPKNFFDGHIDEARVYNRAFSPVEIEKLFNWSAPPSAYWNMDENTGTATVYDKSGNSKDLTMSSAASAGETGAAFKIDHEEGNFSDYDASTSDGGVTSPEISITSGAALAGTSYGMAVIGTEDDINYGQHTVNTLSTDFRVRFYLDPNSVSAISTTMSVLAWFDGGSAVGRVNLFMSGSEHTLQLRQENDAENSINGTAFTITDAPHYVEAWVTRASTADANDGVARIYVDGVLKDTISNIDIYNQFPLIDGLRVGHAGNLATFTGTFYIDEIVFREDSTEIGAAGGSGNPPVWTPGKYGSGLNFTGNNESISMTDASGDFDFVSGQAFTIAGWFKHGIASATQTILSNLESSGTDGGYKLKMESDGDITCETDDDDADTTIDDTATTTAATYDDGNWHHFACVYDTANTDLNIYIDGVLTASDTSTTTNSLDNDDSTFIGIEAASGSEDWAGSLDDIRIYSYARTTGQVVEDMNAGHPAPGSPVGSAIGYWKFDEGAENSCPGGTNDVCNSGSQTTNIDGTSTASRSNAGKIGRALSFDGTDDAVNLGSFTAVDDLPAGGMSISAWIYPTSMGESSQGVIMAKNSGATPSAGWLLQLAGTNAVKFSVDGTADLVRQTANNVITLNAWNHVSLFWDGVIGTASGVRIFVNGMETSYATTTGGSSRVSDASSSLFVGNDSLGTSTFAGIIDEVLLFNFALNTDQIKALRNHGQQAVMSAISTDSSGNPSWSAQREFCPPGNTEGNCGGSNDPSPVLLWKFDENTGTSSARDTSGLANDGTLNGSMTASNWVPGKFGSAISLDGTDDSVSRSDDSDFDYSTSDSFTLNAWFKHATQSAGQDVILNKFESTNSDGGYRIVMESDGDITCGVDTDNSSFPLDSATSTDATYDDNSWHFVSCVKNGSASLQLYIDGKLVATDSSLTGTGTYANDDTFYVGRNAESGGGGGITHIDTVAGSNTGSSSTISVTSATVTSNSSHFYIASIGAGNSTNLSVTSVSGLGLTWNQIDSQCTDNNQFFSSVWYGTGTPTGDGTVTANISGGVAIEGAEILVSRYSGVNLSDPIGNSSSANENGTDGSCSETLADTNTPSVTINTTTGNLAFAAAQSRSATFSSWNNSFTQRGSQNASAGGDASRITAADKTIDAASTTASGTLSGAIDWSIIEAEIKANSVDNSWWLGQIDEVKIYNYARTPAQIAWDYNNGRPVSWLKFDENSGSPTTLNDSSGNGISGSASGTMDVNDWLAGKFNSSLDFDGSDDVLTITNVSAIDLNEGLSQGFTFSAWIYPNTVGETAGRIFQKSSNGSTTDSLSTFCRVTGSTPFGIECNLDLATSDAVFTVSSAVPANQWTHIAFSWTNDSDDEVTVWVNGNPFTSSASFSGDPTVEGNNIYVAGNGTTTSNTRAFDGQIDDFRIFNYELSTQQIRNLINENASVRFGPTSGTP